MSSLARRIARDIGDKHKFNRITRTVAGLSKRQAGKGAKKPPKPIE